jgi:hypothetical protein
LCLALLALAASACGSPFTREDAHFVVSNTTDFRMTPFIDGEAVPAFAPHQVDQFFHSIRVPNNQVNYGGGPSAIDKTVQVSITFKNEASGQLTTPIMCTAGAKATTTIWFENGVPRCTTSAGYGVG